MRSEQTQVPWDPRGFEAEYPCFRGHLLVEGFFVELLVDGLRRKAVDTTKPASNQLGHVKEAARLFFHLYDRAVVEAHMGWRVLCVRAMRLLSSRYSRQVSGLCPVRVEVVRET